DRDRSVAGSDAVLGSGSPFSLPSRSDRASTRRQASPYLFSQATPASGSLPIESRLAATSSAARLPRPLVGPVHYNRRTRPAPARLGRDEFRLSSMDFGPPLARSAATEQPLATRGPRFNGGWDRRMRQYFPMPHPMPRRLGAISA